jgi:hypothetical protein
MMSGDDNFRISLPPGWGGQIVPEPSRPSDVKPKRDKSFEITGGVTCPEVPKLKPDPAPARKASDIPDDPKSVRQRSTRSRLPCRLTIRLQPELLAALDERAEASDRSDSDILREILAEALFQKG